MKAALIYLISFVAGPVVFWVLARQSPARRYFALLWAVTVVLVGTAYAIAQLAAPERYVGLWVILALWLAWIVVMALCVLAARARLPDLTAQRWAMALGAVGTTLPWFGLRVAQMLGG